MKNKSENRERKAELCRIPDAELDIMLVLWQSDKPLRVAAIFDRLRDIRPCSKAAIHSLLERLNERGFVQIRLVGDKKPYKIITPLVSEADYRAAESTSFLKKLCRGSWQPLITTLIDTGALTDEDIVEITGLIEERSSK